jgi:hypothetical protein
MQKSLKLAVLTAFAVGTMGANLALAAPTTAEILSANKAATGGAAWNGKATLKAVYAYDGQGLKGKVESLSDLKTPRFVDSFHIGPIHGANGFDGKQAWEKDPSGTVDVKAGGDARALAVNDGYRRAQLWWRAGYDGAAIRNDGEKHDGGKTYDVLTVTPKGGKPFAAWFDATTHYLVRVREKQGARPVISTLSNYRDYDGVKLAHKTAVVAGEGANAQTQHLTLEEAAFLPPQPARIYAMPKVKVSDYRILGGKHQTTLPFQLINNHIYAKAKVNGKGPFVFIFDTGGVNVVTPPLAKKLGLKSEGDLKIGGAGTKTMKASITHVKALQVGDAVVDNQMFIETALNAMADIEGHPMPGMVGFETFRRFITRIDYGAKTITLIDPKHFDAKDAGTAIPFVLNGRIPEIHGRFEGIPATFDIDTGSRSSLTLTRPFAINNKLRESHPKGIETVDGWGVGGPSTGYVTRGKSMMMGNVKIAGIVTTLADQKKGAFAGNDYSGNIGGGILKRFIVTFDYHNKMMYLKPIKEHIADLDSFDRAGMWINDTAKASSHAGFLVVHVAKGAPAAEAGLKKGDIITAVDGKAAKSLKLYALRQRLRDDKPGTVIDFTVLRGGKAMPIKVTLRDLI